MMAGWARDPVTEVALLGSLLGIGFVGSSALWMSMRIELRESRKALHALRLSTENAIAELQAKIDELRSAPVSEVAPPAPMTVQGLNLTTRTKALRMHHRGESTSSIAAALGIQQEEVELLLKMDRLLEIPAS